MSDQGNLKRRWEQVVRKYEADASVLQDLSLIAAPDPQDDLSDAELQAYFKKNRITPVLIHQLIDVIQAK